MPFVRGRYHINPIAGGALEAARDADEALSTRGGRLARSASDASGRSSETGGQGPIHRVEIEVAEVVPSHSGRAQRGFVARVHRASVATGTPAQSNVDDDFINALISNSGQPAGDAAQGSRLSSQAPETHVFADHQDLTDFLRGEFQNDSGQ
ncbi:MAG TPA: hypothetical protein VMF66_10710 [Candidatus Acidoferrum sp.]|nr:hypothetical protein [Candidatus Acidoferrum sp.]